jgi:nucleoside-diphosphate-sugar epimerase
VGVIHVASPTQSTSDPQKVISAAEKGVLEVLDSALFETRMKRFVLTSSSVAVVEPARAQNIVVTHDMWNNDAVKEAWALSPDSPSRALAVYTASKVQGEQAMWNWVANHQPSFAVNSGILIAALYSRLGAKRLK